MNSIRGMSEATIKEMDNRGRVLIDHFFVRALELLLLTLALLALGAWLLLRMFTRTAGRGGTVRVDPDAAFDLGPVNGFVRRVSGRVQAVSGICTHQGCRLDLSAARDLLTCPCHGATFAMDGANVSHPRPMSSPLPALPRLAVREQNGEIQIYGPTSG